MHPIPRSLRWSLGLVGTSLCLGAGVAAQSPLRLRPPAKVDVAALEAKFRAAAAQLRFLDVSAVLYDRALDRWIGPAEAASYQRHLAAIQDPSLPVDRLRQLIRDPDARVRSCAAVALFHREDPQLLPAIAGLLGDEAPGVPAMGMPPNAWVPGQDPRKVPRPTTPLPLATLAAQLLGFWSDRIAGPKRSVFDAWWAARAKRSHCIGWLDVRIRRATHCTSQMAEWDFGKLRQIHGRVDSLPPIAREMAFIYHANVQHGGHVVDALRSFRPDIGDQSIYAARRLGPQRLMRILRNEPVNDDPDWSLDKRYSGVLQRFVLDHAHAGLLGPEHADALLAMSEKSEAQVWGRSQFLLAAARLQPQRAGAILVSAMARLDHPYQRRERVRCASLLLELTGATHHDFLRKWFYEDHDLESLGSAPERVEFVAGCFRRLRAADFAMLTAIATDPRFAGADFFTVRAFLLGLNAHSLTAVVPLQKLYSVQHPYGMTRFHAWFDRGMKEHPAQTEAVVKTLQLWRSLVPTHLRGLVRRRGE